MKNDDNVVALISQLTAMKEAQGKNPIGYYAAVLGCEMCENKQESFCLVPLSTEEIAELASSIMVINCSDEADPRFSCEDYADAIIHTRFKVNGKKLLAMADKDFPACAELMVLLAEQKRAVYNGTCYSEDPLVDKIEALNKTY